MNKKEFNEMIKAENDRASENKVNIYRCQGCAHATVTRDIDNGTTPFQISCPHCGKTAVSQFYRVEQKLYCTHEFYRPSFEYFQNMKHQGMKHHVEMGGLLFRKIGELE